MKQKFFLCCFLLFLHLFVADLMFAEIKTKFYGYQWLRYTDIVYGADIQGTSGFLVPRTYLRWKMEDKDAGWLGEITLDINNVKGGQEVSTTSTNTGATDADGSGTTITVTHTHVYDKAKGKVDWAIWCKYGYIDFKNIPFLTDIDAKIRVGLQKNYFGTVELWEYPLIEKTITDLRKVISSADLGIALLGELPDGYGSYEFAMHNGSGYKNLESNVEKQYTASLMILPMTGLMIRGSYMKMNQADHGKDSKFKIAQDYLIQYTFDLLIPIKILGEYVVVEDALQYAPQDSKSGVSVGYMIYGEADVFNWLQFAWRFDNWNPDTSKTNDEINLYIVGINLKINENNLLQLNYQLEQPQFGDYQQNKHINTWMGQLKWSW